MTEWEGRILGIFSARYPASAAARGGKRLRLRREAIFPGFDEAKPDDRDTFLDAAERLERAGILELSWERHRKGESLEAATLADSTALYAAIGERAPDDECAKARDEAGRAAVSNDFLRWLSGNLTPVDVENGLNARTVASLAKLLGSVEQSAEERRGDTLPPRALSVALFSDSKEIERLLSVSARAIRRACDAGVAVPDLDRFRRHFPETLVAGKILFLLCDGARLDNSCGLILGIPLPTAKEIAAVSVTGLSQEPRRTSRILGIENKETFHALAARLESGTLLEYDALVYVGGHVNPAVALVFSAFARSGFDLFHSGDLDPDGVLILQELADAAGRPVAPVCMDAETFDRYFRYGRNLENTMHERATLIRDDTRSLPGIEALIERILATGKGIEQEILPFD
jgi:hypothetical protein